MKTLLRRGGMHIEFATDNFQGYCSLLAADFTVQLANGRAVFSMALWPGSDNERVDEEQMHIDGYRGLTIRDERLIEALKRFQRQHRDEISGWTLVANSRGLVLEDPCVLQPDSEGWLRVLISE